MKVKYVTQEEQKIHTEFLL